jgi:hypothetical protein
MEEAVSENFRKIFLLAFTRELIKNFGKKEITKLQNIVEFEERKKESKPQIFIPQKIPRKLIVEQPIFLKREIPRQTGIQIKEMEIPQRIIKPATRSIMRILNI